MHYSEVRGPIGSETDATELSSRNTDLKRSRYA